MFAYACICTCDWVFPGMCHHCGTGSLQLFCTTTTSLLPVCACMREGQILTQSICTITFVTFLSFESDLMLVANFQRESRQLTHKHLAARSDKDNKEKQVTGTVCVGVCERASALTQCVSVFVIQPSQRKQSLSSIPLLSPSSPSLSLLDTVS